VKLVSLGRRSRAVAQETLDPLEAALQPAVVDGRWRVPDRFNFTRDVVEVLAEESRRRALTFLGPDGVLEPRTFRQLAEGSSRWAAQLREHGVRPGDRVVVVVGKTPAWIEVMLAGMKIGAVTVPCAPALSSTALGIRIATAGAKLVVAERASGAAALPEGGPTVLYVEDADELPERRLGEEPTHDSSSRDLAFLLTTSGVAGGPYGVQHTHGAAFAARHHAEHWLLARPGDVVWCTTDTASPLTVWTLLLGPWSRGAEIVLHEGPFDPAERLDLLRRFEVTILCQPPTEYRALAEAGETVLARHLPQRLRRMVSAGDFLSSDVVAAFEQAWGLPVEDAYAQTECGVVIGHGEDLGVESGSVGHPLPGYDVAIVDENGNDVPAGTEGQLALRGRPPSLFSGYWEAPEETKATFRGDLYLTGDLARLDGDGAVWLLGRATDVIMSGEHRFSPFEVEQALFGHRAVAEAGVVGIRDLQRGGQYVRAFVLLEPGVEGSDRLVAEIRQHLRHTLPEDKVPREVEFVDSLPTSSGKILRHELREWQPLGMEPVWKKAPRLPGTPAPVTTFVPEPEPPAPIPAEEDEPLPDFVVPPSETYAARARQAGIPEPGDAELEDEELPDYIVIPAPAPLPEHVVSFLNADPLPNIPAPPDAPPAPRRPEARAEPRVRDDPPPAPPESTLDPPPAPAPPPVPEPPPAVEAPPTAEPPRPRARAVPRPIEAPRTTVDPAFAFGPTPGTKPKPRTRPISDPSPPPAPPEPPAPPAAPATPAAEAAPPPAAPAPAPPAPAAKAAPPPAAPSPAPPAPAAKAAPPPAAPAPPAPQPAKAKAPAPAAKARPATAAPAKPAAKPAAKPTEARAAAKPASPKPAPKRTEASKAPGASAPAPAKRTAQAKQPARPKAPSAAASPPQAPRKPPAKPKPAAALPEDNGRAASPEETGKKRGLRRRKEKPSKEARVAAAAEKKAAIQRSAPEPGMENLELDWMKGLSSRLSAYTISPEDEPATPATPADSQRGDDGEDAE
jgi:acyl-coenzyme A synthetase/AMP-(fatty) acid ligase